MSAPVPFPLGNNKWRKRKRDSSSSSSLLTNNNNNNNNNKKQRPEDEDEDDEDIDDEIEAEEDEDLHPIPSLTTAATASELQQHSSREHEVLSDGGVRISDFPLVIEHTVNRPHSSVLSIVAAEKSLHQFPLNRNQNPTLFLLENISHGQLQALSSVPIDSPSLNPSSSSSSSSDNDRSDGSSSSFVCTPPPIMEGRGVIKRFSNNRVLVVPMHADWFSPNSIHRLERQVVPHFFSGKSGGDHTPEKYMECRNQIVGKYMGNPEKRLWTTDCQGLVGGVDVHDLNRIVRFLDHWGIINYSAEAPNREPRIGGPFLREDTNGEVHIPSSALRSIYSLIHFDKPKSRIKPEDICSFDGADLDNRIRERLSENHCNYCSKSLTGVHYQSQKDADILLCSACFHEGRFVVGHSSTDFARVDFAKALCDLDGDSWTDQETLLLLEAVEIYNDSWNDIAEHVATKSKAQCILHFIRLPMEDGILENIDVPSKSVSSNVPTIEDHARPYANSNGGSSMSSIPNLHSSNKKTLCLQDLDSESRLPFANSSNPVMALVAFLASSVGPRVAAACAHASLASLSKEDYQLDTSGSIMQTEGSSDRISTESTRSKEGGLQGSATSFKQPKEETQAAQGSVHESHAHVAPMPPESVKIAAKLGLAAAAMKAKLFADHEEREIQRMAASIINHQLKRLELKLKQFAEVETLLMKEGENVERTRQRLAAERVRVISTRFLPGGAAPTTSSPAMPGAAGSPVSVANNIVNNRQQAISASPAQTNISGYANSPAIHPHMSFLQRQQPMFTFGPRLPLSAIHPSSSTTHPTTAMFSAAPGNTTPTLTSHPMLRPVSGTNTNAG